MGSKEHTMSSNAVDVCSTIKLNSFPSMIRCQCSSPIVSTEHSFKSQRAFHCKNSVCWHINKAFLPGMNESTVHLLSFLCCILTILTIDFLQVFRLLCLLWGSLTEMWKKMMFSCSLNFLWSGILAPLGKVHLWVTFPLLLCPLLLLEMPSCQIYIHRWSSRDHSYYIINVELVRDASSDEFPKSSSIPNNYWSTKSP